MIIERECVYERQRREKRDLEKKTISNLILRSVKVT